MKNFFKIKLFLMTEIFLNCSFILASYSQISITPFASGFPGITDIKSAGDDRLFIVEKGGIIKIVDRSGNVKPDPFLNIQSEVYNASEQGLLGLAFSPNFKN